MTEQKQTAKNPFDAQRFKSALEAKIAKIDRVQAEMKLPDVYGAMSLETYDTIHYTMVSERARLIVKLERVCRDWNWNSELLSGGDE